MNKYFGFGLLALIVSACAAGPEQSFQRVDEAAFRSGIVGKSLDYRSDFDATVVAAPDGTMSVTGAQSHTGTWEWADGYFCRDLPTHSVPNDCQLVERSGNLLRFTRDRGAGDTSEWTIEG